MMARPRASAAGASTMSSVCPAAMASSWAAKHPDDFDGLVLLGAYVYGDVPAEKSLVLYGTEDGVLSRDKLSGGPNEQVIPGGNHAQFGNYGVQPGDGNATISTEEQQKLAANLTLRLLRAVEGE